jgi:hypothetical protein
VKLSLSSVAAHGEAALMLPRPLRREQGDLFLFFSRYARIVLVAETRFLPPKNAFFATQKVAFFATSSEAPLLLDTLPRDSGAESAYSGVFSER